MSTDFLTSVINKMEATKIDLESLLGNTDSYEKIIKIDPDKIGNWEYRDRQNFELGDIENLAESIELKGQAQPIIVVKADQIFKSTEEQQYQYIIVAGYRRWLACKSRNLLIDAVVRNLTFDQAILCLVSENEKEAISDFSKGMFYYKLLANEKVTKKILYEKLGLKKSMFNNYLSFAEVAEEIWQAVGNLQLVSARTSAAIKLICQKSEAHKQAIITIADKIAQGIGEKKIISLVQKILAESTLSINKKQNDTRVAFSKNLDLNLHKNHIRINFQGINKEKITLLTEKIAAFMKTIAAEFNQ